MAKATVLPRFKQLQHEFAAHLRDPSRNPPPMGVEDRRMKIYRELFYNNVENFIARGFPVLRRLYDDVGWHQLVRDYFARHRSSTPFFHGIGKEFLNYLQSERGARAGDPPFLFELAHYEWVESALAMDETVLDMANVNPDGDLLDGVPVLSALAWSIAYQFPVQRITPEFRPASAPAQPTYIVVYRDLDDRVGFLEINAVTARLLQLIEQQPERRGREQLLQIAQELKHPDPDRVIESGRDMLHSLRGRDILLGTRRN